MDHRVTSISGNLIRRLSLARPSRREHEPRGPSGIAFRSHTWSCLVSLSPRFVGLTFQSTHLAIASAHALIGSH